MTSFHVTKESLLDNWSQTKWVSNSEMNVQLSVYGGEKKHLWFLQRGPATYGSHLRRTSITLSTSPFTLSPASLPYRSRLCSQRKGGREEVKGKSRIAAFL